MTDNKQLSIYDVRVRIANSYDQIELIHARLIDNTISDEDIKNLEKVKNDLLSLMKCYWSINIL